MCGITGYACSKGVKESDIEKMNHALRHRGPDDSGIYINKNNTIGLGHRRLSIIDLYTGRQPMANEDKTLWITFNGEIYNFKEIKNTLAERHYFQTKSRKQDLQRIPIRRSYYRRESLYRDDLSLPHSFHWK